MRLTDPPQERRRFQLIAVAMAFVITATALGFFVVVIFSAEDQGPSATVAAIAPTATPAILANVTEGVSLTGPVALRSGPAEDVAIVTRLAATDEIRVLGRSSAGDWLVIGALNRPDITGWVPSSFVTGVDVSSLPVIAGPGATLPEAEGTLTPDLPDLVIARAFSRDNQLWVELLNQGAADASGEFLITVNGGAPIALAVRPGESLRAGQRIEAPVAGHYLQLRSNVSITSVPLDERAEEDTENNTWTGIVGPDVPNDIEILSAVAGTAGEPLVVTVRNNSPTPIAGLFTLSVREALPSMQLLGRERVSVEVNASETFDVVFQELTDVDMTRVSIIMGTDAIDDANLANNVYPR